MPRFDSGRNSPLPFTIFTPRPPASEVSSIKRMHFSKVSSSTTVSGFNSRTYSPLEIRMAWLLALQNRHYLYLQSREPEGIYWPTSPGSYPRSYCPQQNLTFHVFQRLIHRDKCLFKKTGHIIVYDDDAEFHSDLLKISENSFLRHDFIALIHSNLNIRGRNTSTREPNLIIPTSSPCFTTSPTSG